MNPTKSYILRLCLVMLSLAFTTLQAQTIPSDTINEILQSKKEELLSKYDQNSVVKPQKEIVSKDDYQAKELKKGMFEKTPNFNTRVKDEQNRVDELYTQAIETTNKSYQKKLKIYNKKVAKIKQNIQNIKDNMNTSLVEVLKDSLILSQGLVKIESFDDYNADDEIFRTYITSKDLKIQIQLEVSLKEAEKLYKSNNIKNLKPTIILEYSDNKIYLNNVKVTLKTKGKEKSYHANIVEIKNFDTTFKLNFKLPDTYIYLNDGKTKEQVRLAKIEEQRVAKKEKQKLARIDKGSYIQPAMVKIKAGSFMMGSNSGDDDEKPVHKVTIKKDFYIGKYEVTIKEYKKFTNDTNSNYPEWEEEGNKYNIKTGSSNYYKKMCFDNNCPIMGMSWNNVKKYTKWLSKKTGKTYRLPTEAEWEYVARAGTTTKYSFGDSDNSLGSY
ncbi:MAG: formylglycine-generating enzyme family protein, partial [Sulfurimonas sp.]|nr:formylglycine-generating enzyme family protein [Sulfurimonas sp.]